MATATKVKCTCTPQEEVQEYGLCSHGRRDAPPAIKVKVKMRLHVGDCPCHDEAVEFWTVI